MRRYLSPYREAWIGRQAPYLAMNQFSLMLAGPLLRLELLYELQRRDVRGGRIDPLAARLAVRELCDWDTLVPDAPRLSARKRMASSNTAGLVREIAWTVGVGYNLFRGVEPADKRTWDLVDARSGRSRTVLAACSGVEAGTCRRDARAEAGG
jgi:hypothetical protein